MFTSVLVALVALGSSSPTRCPEVAVGGSGLLVYGAVSADPSVALEATARGPITPVWGWAAGIRTALAPVRIEGFGRFELGPELGAWRPLAGLELGVGSRGHYEDGSGIVGELALTSRRDLVPVYAALHTAPLRFGLGEHWTLSVAELHLGTFIVPAGRYVRLGVGFVTIGWTP